MIDFLRDPLWQFVGAVLAVIAIVITIVIYYRQRQKKTLSYIIITDTPVLTVDEQLQGKLEVLYEGSVVKDVQLVVLKIINTGNQAIATADFERPLVIAFGTDAKILSSEILAFSPPDLAPSIASTDQSICLEPLLLNPKDHVTIKTLVSERTAQVSLTGRIIGVERIGELVVPKRKQFYLLLIGVAMGLATGYLNLKAENRIEILTAVITMLAGAGLIVLSSTLQENKSKT